MLFFLKEYVSVTFWFSRKFRYWNIEKANIGMKERVQSSFWRIAKVQKFSCCRFPFCNRLLPGLINVERSLYNDNRQFELQEKAVFAFWYNKIRKSRRVSESASDGCGYHLPCSMLNVCLGMHLRFLQIFYTIS